MHSATNGARAGRAAPRALLLARRLDTLERDIVSRLDGAATHDYSAIARRSSIREHTVAARGPQLHTPWATIFVLTLFA